jgi:hypothetical protein
MGGRQAFLFRGKMSLSAEQILNATIPGQIFSCPELLETEFKELIRKWHPDHSKHPKATDILTQLNMMRSEGKKLAQVGNWEYPNKFVFTTTDKKERRIRFRRKKEFELGTILYGHKIVAFVVKNDFADLVERARQNILGMTYPGELAKFKTVSPNLKGVFHTNDSRIIVVFETAEELFHLSDILDHYKGQIPPEHVAWLINRVYDHLCLLLVNRMTLNDISPDTLWVSPSQHSVTPLGGWFYSVKTGYKLDVLPAFSAKYCSLDMKRQKIAQPDLDLRLIKLLGLKLMGSVTNPKFQPMLQFLKEPSEKRAYDDYKSWNKNILGKVFGKRRFIEMPLTARDIYGD